jgi:hypothetical protein
MVMTKDMIFSKEDYLKLSVKQKDSLRAAKGLPPFERNQNYNVKAHYSLPSSTPTIPTPPPIHTPSAQPDSHLRQILSNKHTRLTSTNPTTSNTQYQVEIDGNMYQRVVNTIRIQYNVHSSLRNELQGSLIDGGANGGMSGADVRVIEQTLHHADISGIAEHSVSNLPICTVAGVIETSTDKIIGIFHQYAHLGTGKTIHSSNQLRSFGIEICDTPLSLGGKQRILHTDGYCIPLSIRNGLPYMDMYAPSDKELDSLEHVFFTSDMT